MSLEGLVSLEELYLEQNYFSQVPLALRRLEHLDTLDLSANPLSSLSLRSIFINGFVYTPIESTTKRAKAYWEACKKRLLLSIVREKYEKASRQLKQVLPYIPLIAEGNKDVLIYSFRYLIELGVSQETIAKHPQLLAIRPDAIAKALRIFKLEVLGLKRFDWSDVNGYCNCLFASPENCLSKIQYLLDSEFGYTHKFSLFWQKITKRKTKAQMVREKLLEILQIFEGPLKGEAGAWMEEYNFWAIKFEMRRERKLIRRI